MTDQITALNKLEGQILEHFRDIREYISDQESSILGLIDGMKMDIKIAEDKELAERDAWADKEEAKNLAKKQMYGDAYYEGQLKGEI